MSQKRASAASSWGLMQIIEAYFEATPLDGQFQNKSCTKGRKTENW
jgi:hypothetical protein